jgi:hypothetical protein
MFTLKVSRGRCESKIGLKGNKVPILYHFMQYSQVAEDERVSGKKPGNPRFFGQNAPYISCQWVGTKMPI